MTEDEDELPDEEIDESWISWVIRRWWSTEMERLSQPPPVTLTVA